jgi:AICAR transformylase/IMP cyclohydrolase PurH
MAPVFTAELLRILSTKRNIRILRIDPVFKCNEYDLSR